MERRAKVELFEEIRREYEFGVGSVRAVARKLGVHRRGAGGCTAARPQAVAAAAAGARMLDSVH